MTRRARCWLRLVAATLLVSGCDDWRRYEPDPGPDPVAGSAPAYCREAPLVLNAAAAAECEACRPASCNLEPDGSVTFSYALDDPTQWAICVVATDKNLNGFDPDQGGQGVLEVVYCADRPMAGPLNLWYLQGDGPNRKKFLQLLGSGETMDHAGCRTVSLAPGMARFPAYEVAALTPEDQALSLPQACSYRCGHTPAECTLDYGSVELMLGGEWLQEGATVEAQLRLLSVKHLSAACACDTSLDCDGERSYCHTNTLASVLCEAQPDPAERGICTSGGVLACGSDLVGWYRDGWHPAASDAFATAYQRHLPRLGCPFDDGGGSPYVHDVRGVALQDYAQSDPALGFSRDGQAALILNPGLLQAFLVFGAIRDTYECLRHGGEGHGGGVLLGAPVGERLLDGTVVRQVFQWGSVELGGTFDEAVTVRLDARVELDADVTAACTWGTVDIVNPP